jgi:hypothetical protein
VSTFIGPDGSGRWLPDYFPFWTRNKRKLLSSLYQIPLHCHPVGSADIFTECSVRVIELVELTANTIISPPDESKTEEKMCSTGSNIIAVVEVVHRRRWMNILRLVVLDVPLLVQAMQGKRVNIPVYDEVEWLHMRRSSAVGDGEREVDFRNTCLWGVHSIPYKA